MDYPYIRAWGRDMGSHMSFIADQVAQARKDKAPADALYKRTGEGQDGSWATWSEFNGTAVTRDRIEAMVAKMGEAA